MFTKRWSFAQELSPMKARNVTSTLRYKEILFLSFFSFLSPSSLSASWKVTHSGQKKLLETFFCISKEWLLLVLKSIRFTYDTCMRDPHQTVSLYNGTIMTVKMCVHNNLENIWMMEVFPFCYHCTIMINFFFSVILSKSTYVFFPLPHLFSFFKEPSTLSWLFISLLLNHFVIILWWWCIMHL